MPVAVIAQAQQISQAKAEEILTAAGYDPNKPYSEQAKAKVNVIPDGDEVRVVPIVNNNRKINFTTAVDDKVSANDKDAKLRQTILDMHSIFTSEEIAKYLGLSEIFVAKVLDESD